MLSLDLQDRLVPPLGHILFRRDERPVAVRGIVIPDRARVASRAAMATVLRVAADIRELRVGDRILLGATVGAKKIFLGDRDEVVLEACRPSQVLGVVLEASTVENHGEHALAHYSPSLFTREGEPFDEGDPLAIR